MLNDYVIAIPSYKRAETLRDKTLALLQKYEVPKERIYVFVADATEYEKYKEVVSDLVGALIIGKLGMRNIRNFIQDEFSPGQYIVNIDDDIQNLQEMMDKKTVRDLDGWHFNRLIEMGFEICEKKKCNLWGIYPLVNPGFMYKKATLDLKYIIGAFWGVINTHDKETYVTLDDKEDFERTIKFFIRDRKVLRFNHVGIKSAYYTEKGGMQETRTEKRVRNSGMELLQKYPMFCEYNKARKKHFEIRLVDKTSRN